MLTTIISIDVFKIRDCVLSCTPLIVVNKDRAFHKSHNAYPDYIEGIKKRDQRVI